MTSSEPERKKSALASVLLPLMMAQLPFGATLKSASACIWPTSLLSNVR